MIAVEPERSRALARRAWPPASRSPSSRSPIADGLNAPYAGPNCVAQCLRARRRVVLVTEEEIEDAFRFLYGRAKLAVRGRRRRHDGRAPGREGAARAAPAPSPPSSREATWPPKRPLLSWPGDEGRHPSRVRPGHRHCSCGNTFETRSTKAELHVEICSHCHPSTRASRSSSTPAAGSSASSAGSRRPARRG